MPSCIVSFTAAKYGKKVAVLDYVSPSSQGKEEESRFHFGLTLDSEPGVSLRTFARKFSNIDFFLRILPLKVDELLMSEM